MEFCSVRYAGEICEGVVREHRCERFTRPFWRSILHVAVEQQNRNLVKSLLCAGFNSNVKKRCGVISLLIAVTLKKKDICKLLVKSRVSVRGPLVTNISSPLTTVLKMELAEIVEILNPCVSDAEDDDIAAYDPIFS